MDERSMTCFYYILLALLFAINTFTAAENGDHTKCQKEANMLSMPGAFIPQCDEMGNYLPMQCDGNTGYCWCVNKDGEKIVGSKRLGEVNCKGHFGKTKCQHKASRIPSGGQKVYKPQCDEMGNYLPMQCHPRTGDCWCVDNSGSKTAEKEPQEKETCRKEL
ncbi:saxiphilin-like [Protopterus annectens]|uniref:saxiphilin-like n=1 Tax=Protopterus annectens TaxID=7888 RepID=UPI001CFA9151|nr:saxiphilin-like [Protopterus annectens]